MKNKQKEFLKQLDELFNPPPDVDEAVMLLTLMQLQKARENQLMLEMWYKKHFNQITKIINPLNNENK